MHTPCTCVIVCTLTDWHDANSGSHLLAAHHAEYHRCETGQRRCRRTHRIQHRRNVHECPVVRRHRHDRPGRAARVPARRPGDEGHRGAAHAARLHPSQAAHDRPSGLHGFRCPWWEFSRSMRASSALASRRRERTRTNIASITYDYTLAAARALPTNPALTFVYVSGEGTDSTERGRLMWARVKGRTENALLAMPFRAYMFRPGYIQPLHGAVAKTGWYRWLYVALSWLYPLLRRLAPAHVTTTEKWRAPCWRSRPARGPASASFTVRRSTARRLRGDSPKPAAPDAIADRGSRRRQRVARHLAGTRDR